MREAAISTRRTIPAIVGSAEMNCAGVSFCRGALGSESLCGIGNCRDELAPDVVLEPLPLFASPFVHEGTELRAEDISEPAPCGGWQSMQQDARGAVRRENLAIIVDGQQASAERVQIFAAIMEGDQDVPAMLFAEQPVLDLGRGHRDERLGMGLPGHAVRRGVQYPRHLAVGREDRRRHAGQVVVA